MATSVNMANSVSATNQLVNDQRAVPYESVASPSAYIISKQFLLQFYAVRNRYPSELYRFYADNSQVTYPGGMDNYQITGKHEIRDVIGRMNFDGSKTVVSKLNAQFVDDEYMVILTNGHIVWQNENEPKPFHETFVLIKSSPKAFYVKNNILHLDGQDTYDPEKVRSVENGYSVDDGRQHAVSGTESEIKDNNYVCDSNVENPTENNKQENAAPDSEKQWTTDVIASHQYNGGSDNKDEVDEPVENHVLEVNNVDHWNDEEVKENNVSVVAEHHDNEHLVTEDAKEEVVEDDTSVVPKTWAMICKKNHANAPIVPTNGIQPTVVPAPSSTYSNNGDEKPVNGTGTGKPRRSVRNGSADKRPGNKPVARGNVAAVNGQPNNTNGRRSPRADYPEEQQLFVGNIPQWAEDNVLREFFSQYGKVLDIKVNQSHNTKPNGRHLPNYGFVVMESAEVVQKMLAQKPMMMDNHRLNVEEKKRGAKR